MAHDDVERLEAAAGGWTAALVHLAGDRRGVAERLKETRITIGSGAEAGVHLPGRSGQIPATHHATLQRRGTTYELTVVPEQAVWVNGERVDHMVLASGDVIEVGRGGPVLRFRSYPPGRGPFKTEAKRSAWGWDPRG